MQQPKFFRRTAAWLVPPAASLVAILTACGGAPPTATQAPVTPTPPSAAPPGSAPAPKTPAAPEPAAASEPASAPSASTPDTTPVSDSSAPVRSQKPIDVITARDAAFLVDYASSAHKQAAEARCEKESKGDAEKQAACLTKARDKFLPDVLRFRRDSATQVSLVVYKRNGSQLAEVSVGVVQLTEEGSDGVRLKFKGQKGPRPVWRGRLEALIQVPNGYSIELDDPELGHLRYDAKVGLVSQ